MTNEEAIKELSYIADEMPSMECGDWKEAIYMAIKALEQQPCEDCISREEAIKTIQRYGVGSQDFEDYTPEHAERFVIQKLSELPPVKPVTVWHKFKGGELPPKNGYYLWVAEGGAIEKDFYWDGEWEHAKKYGYKLIAWTELPEWEE